MPKTQRHENMLKLIMLRIEQEGGRITEKTGWFWTALHWVVFIITFGSNRRFKDGYYTTFGPIIGVPLGWERGPMIERIAVLEHELVHVRQCKRLGFGNVWLGFPLYGFLYLLFPLPIGVAYFRWRYEREAYVHGINIELQLYATFSKDLEALRARMINRALKQLTTGAYAWTWPFKKNARRYFESHVTPALAFSKVANLK